MAPMTEVIKGSSFQWSPKAQTAFDEIKLKRPSLPYLVLTRYLKWSVMHPGLELEEFLLKKATL